MLFIYVKVEARVSQNFELFMICKDNNIVTGVCMRPQNRCGSFEQIGDLGFDVNG